MLSETMIKARAGDKDAIEQLYKENVGLLHQAVGNLRRMTRMNDDDLFQEASILFLYCLKKWDPDRGAKFSGFLFRCLQQRMWERVLRMSLIPVRNQTIKSTKKELTKRRIDQALQPIKSISYWEKNYYYTKPIVDVRDTVEQIMRCVSDTDRAIMKGVMDGLTYKQIGSSLGLATNTVGEHVRKLKDVLRK